VGKRTGLRVYGLGPAKCRMRYSCNRIGDRCVDNSGVHAVTTAGVPASEIGPGWVIDPRAASHRPREGPRNGHRRFD
jgi:hypothetical protein